MKQTLHLFKDDKFIDHFINNLQKIDNIENHCFISYDIKGHSSFKYIKSKHVNYKALKKLCESNEINQYDNIVIHNLTDELWPLINKLKDNIRLFWILFGADFYPITNYNLYQPETLKYLNNIGIKKYIPNVIIKYKNKLSKKQKAKKKIIMIKRVNYMLHYNPYEIDIVKKITGSDARYVEFKYGKFGEIMSGSYNFNDNVFNDLFQRDVTKSMIIGNSGNPSNNHIEAFTIIKNNRNLENYYVIVPLSYGNKDYIDYIIKIGTNMFGEKFLPLKKFISPLNYFSLLKKVNIGIYNHNRGQGAGNILPMAWLGKPIFLQEKNLLYPYLKSLGINSFKMEELINFHNTNMNFTENNRYKIIQNFSKTKVLDNMNEIVKIFQS